MKVSVCYFVHNDLAALRTVLPYEMRWADEICVLDMASTDGTKEFCEAFLRPQDKYQRRDENTCPILGFGEARTAAAMMATGDWVLTSDADIVMHWQQADLIKRVLERSTVDVLSVAIAEVRPPLEGKTPMTNIEQVFDRMPRPFRPGNHRVLLRNGVGIDFKGYIHEEPFRGEVNCYAESRPSGLMRLHFHNWVDNPMRGMRYSWMLLRAAKNPELQKYTNRWWYDEYVPKHREHIEHQAAQYEELNKNRHKMNRVEEISAFYHSVLRAYCESIGEPAMPEWKDTEDWHKNAIRARVEMHLKDPRLTPQQSHEIWRQRKLSEGWEYAPVKDFENKKHPCMVPFEKLPPLQQMKHKYFGYVLSAYFQKDALI